MAGKLNRNIEKAKNTHLSYLGSMKENDMFLTPTTSDDIVVLIDNVNVNERVGLNRIPTSILKDLKLKFLKPLGTMSILLLHRFISQFP